jgi:hypothetical protein
MDLLEFIDLRARLGQEKKYVVVDRTAVFCDDSSVFEFAKQWDSAATLLETHNLVSGARVLFELAKALFKWREPDAEELKMDYPIAFHEHCVWLAANLCLTASHFKMIEKVESDADRAGLFRGLQTLASRNSPYGGPVNSMLEAALQSVQKRCLEEAQLASAHWHFQARHVREAITILEEIPESKRTKLLFATIKSYNKGKVPEASLYSVQLLAPAIPIPSINI